MKKGKVFLAGCMILALALGLAVTNAAALPVFSYGDSQYVGYIDPNAPSSTALEKVYITNLKNLTPGTTGTYTDLPHTNFLSRVDSSLTGLPDVGNFTVGSNIANTLAAGLYNGMGYVLAKYDGPNAGAMVWFVDLSQGFELPTSWNGGSGDTMYGLSHFNVYGGTAVPEPSMLLLLGSGMLGLAALRRRFRK